MPIFHQATGYLKNCISVSCLTDPKTQCNSCLMSTQLKLKTYVFIINVSKRKLEGIKLYHVNTWFIVEQYQDSIEHLGQNANT